MASIKVLMFEYEASGFHTFLISILFSLCILKEGLNKKILS